MQLGISDILSALGFLLALAVQTWALTRFLITRMDLHKEKLEAKIEASQRDSSSDVANTNARINEVKDQYVKRTDIDRDLAQMNHSINNVNVSLNTQMTGVNTRLDTIISAIAQPKS